MDQRGLRNRWGLIVLIALLVLVVGRLAVLQGVDGAEYANAAEQDRLRTYPIAALRGAVLDRDGHPFAYTVDASRVVADPEVVRDPARTALALTDLLDVPVPELTEKLSEDSRYVVLASQDLARRRRTPSTRSSWAGIFFEDDPVRLYPAGHGGRAGDRLRRPRRARAWPASSRPSRRSSPARPGSGGWRWAAAATPSPPGIDESSPATDGDTVTLTIDQDLQYVAEERLGRGVRRRRDDPGLGGRPRREDRAGRGDGLLPRLRPGRLPTDRSRPAGQPAGLRRLRAGLGR